MTRRSLISQQPWVYPLAMSACEAAPLGAKGMTMAITDASLPVNWLSRRGLLRTGLAAFLAFAALGPNSAVADRDNEDQHWVGTWSTAPLSRTAGVAFSDQSLRDRKSTRLNS